MIHNEKRKAEYYKALIEKSPDYEGIFYVGVTSTGVFCRPTCPARKPKYENCEFYENAQQALLASFRPCQRCRPLSHPNQVSDLVRLLVEAVEHNPEKRWKGQDFRALSIDESTARRQFKKRFGMTFVEYARARRMGLALKSIRSGEKIIHTQLASGYDSSSGFRDAFSRIMGAPPTRLDDNCILKAAWLDTRLGPMVAIADENKLYLLEFVDRRGLEREVERLRKRMNAAIIPGDTKPIQSIERELAQYFESILVEFKTPLYLMGSSFQQSVWEQLRKISPGETRSYADIAAALGKPTAFRAVAQANGANQLAIVIPCHRVINSDGGLGGYGGGIVRKEWLLNHEKHAQAIATESRSSYNPPFHLK
ncbi:bifunctional transcriptional activator/DNA repair enzyme AdaA [Cohnella sp. REN36]|uniref:bifunctional transcriptional activator/DNA repair enzyme AdaA n=1 Tax=Cohnella sp. REN36 TaxID=2887347 RepID=UPI001D15AE60|nr:trifunctional transcriptional activator/DNA repair protein Ada/methylated-DNA--[protein]-cysteine S-methyltransferase [Cohnella sp. REN36]MCC3374166.1 trifunctional transcriptional activator/DNA repair protein Ada/methylated-DNA--[protein]-cysteine S-methyltransferase [Cohnella sp. REN36]